MLPENGILPIDQAMPQRGFDEKLSGSNHSLNKSAPNGTLKNRKTRVHFTPSDSDEKDEVENQTVSTLAPLKDNVLSQKYSFDLMVKQTVLSENYGHRFLSKAISVGFKKHSF